MILLAFIIFISYTSKFFGLFAVLLVIIAFNQNQSTVYSYNYFEGFDGSGNNIDASGNNTNVKKDLVANKIKSIADTTQATSSVASNSSVSPNNSGKEGFCMTDRELNILRGKQSNSIRVYNKSREQDDNVDPSDKSVFSSDYASF